MATHDAGHTVADRVPPQNSNRLTVLADEIRQADAAARRSAQALAEAALEAGHKLLEAKELVGHGNWLPWLKEHCQLTERTAQRYMRLAGSGLKSDTVTDLGIRGALDAIAAQKDPRTEALATMMRECGLRGEYAVDGIIFPEDLSYQEWVAIGEVLRRLSDVPRRHARPPMPQAVLRDWADEGMRRAKAGAFDPSQAKSKLEFIENMIFDTAWIDCRGYLPMHPEDIDDREVRSSPGKPYAEIDAAPWWKAQHAVAVDRVQ